MEIRKANINDTGAIVRVALDTWDRITVPETHLNNLPYDAWVNSYKKSISKDNVFVYVAENETQQIIGFAAAGPIRFQNFGYRGELYAIYVLSDHQRKGIGSLLLRAIFDRFKQLGIYSVIVMALADNPYKKFYEINGGKKINAKSMGVKGFSGDLIVYGWPDIRIL